jgi:hypothetical protein
MKASQAANPSRPKANTGLPSVVAGAASTGTSNASGATTPTAFQRVPMSAAEMSAASLLSAAR